MDEKIGNVRRKAYIHFHLKGDAENVAGSDFDMMFDLKNCLTDQIQELKTLIANQDACTIKRIHPKIPLTWFETIIAVGIILWIGDAGLLKGWLAKFLLDIIM